MLFSIGYYLLTTTNESCTLENKTFSLLICVFANVIFPFIQVVVILIAHYLKFPVAAESQTFSSGLAVKSLCFTSPVVSQILRLNPEVRAIFLSAQFGNIQSVSSP